MLTVRPEATAEATAPDWPPAVAPELRLFQLEPPLEESWKRQEVGEAPLSSMLAPSLALK